MRSKKRYLVLSKYPESLPDEAEFLFQDDRGFVFKASLRATEILRSEALFISGSLKKVKTRPKGLNRRTN